MDNTSPVSPVQKKPTQIVNDDEITLVIYREEAVINIAYQRSDGMLTVAAFSPETGDPQGLSCHRFDLSPEERQELTNMLNHPDIRK